MAMIMTKATMTPITATVTVVVSAELVIPVCIADLQISHLGNKYSFHNMICLHIIYMYILISIRPLSSGENHVALVNEINEEILHYTDYRHIYDIISTN